MGSEPTVGAVFRQYVREQVEHLQAQVSPSRKDEPDAVHQLRVAARRLRSALATYRPILDCSVSEPIRDELKWLSQQASGARDAEVLRARLEELVDIQQPGLVLGPVRARIALELSQRHRDAHQELISVLDDSRFEHLLQLLEQLADSPPYRRHRAGKAASHELPKLLGHVARRVDQAAEQAEQTTPGKQRDQILHDVRKAAKRARYAAESTTSLGKRVKKLGKRMEQVQDVLGEHQDAVTAQDAIRQLAVAAHLAGENGFTFGRLHGLEHERAQTALDEYRLALKKAQKHKLRKALD